MKVQPEQVVLTRYEVDHGDKRSYGRVDLEAQTPCGLLVGGGNLGSSGDLEDQVWTLDGKELPNDPPDLGVPHHYAGHRALARFEAVKDQEAREVLAAWLSDLE